MCLIDEVLEWDATRSRCRSATHRSPQNPLRAYGRLGAACGIEYAAQSMAVHGALAATAGRRPAAGYLASVRNVVCHATRLDLLVDDLEVTATRLAGDHATAVYEFSLRTGQGPILTGRAG